MAGEKRVKIRRDGKRNMERGKMELIIRGKRSPHTTLGEINGEPSQIFKNNLRPK